MNSGRPKLTLLGQTPPPWHGQAVASKILFDHDWPDYEADRIRMEFSAEMDEVGRFHLKKIQRLFQLIGRVRCSLKANPDNILFYPPSSANWVPFIRDVIFLTCVRGLANKTVFIFHASGLAGFTQRNWITRGLARLAYQGADLALEVAEEKVAPHQVFQSRSHQWCPCGIESPLMPAKATFPPGKPLSVLFVGSLQEGKGILEILRTAAQLKDTGHGQAFRFNLVGRWMNDGFRDEVMAMHRDLNLEEMVTFVGQLTGDEKWKAYHNADAFFFPTHYPTEASPIVLMEALAAGLPVITTQWNGIPALLEGCTTAKLLPIHAPEAYAHALIELQSELDRGMEYSLAAREFYENRFTPERFIQRVEKALRQATL